MATSHLETGITDSEDNDLERTYLELENDLSSNIQNGQLNAPSNESGKKDLGNTVCANHSAVCNPHKREEKIPNPSTPVEDSKQQLEGQPCGSVCEANESTSDMEKVETTDQQFEQPLTDMKKNTHHNESDQHFSDLLKGEVEEEHCHKDLKNGADNAGKRIPTDEEIGLAIVSSTIQDDQGFVEDINQSMQKHHITIAYMINYIMMVAYTYMKLVCEFSGKESEWCYKCKKEKTCSDVIGFFNIRRMKQKQLFNFEPLVFNGQVLCYACVVRDNPDIDGYIVEGEGNEVVLPPNVPLYEESARDAPQGAHVHGPALNNNNDGLLADVNSGPLDMHYQVDDFIDIHRNDNSIIHENVMFIDIHRTVLTVQDDETGEIERAVVIEAEQLLPDHDRVMENSDQPQENVGNTHEQTEPKRIEFLDNTGTALGSRTQPSQVTVDNVGASRSRQTVEEQPAGISTQRAPRNSREECTSAGLSPTGNGDEVECHYGCRMQNFSNSNNMLEEHALNFPYCPEVNQRLNTEDIYRILRQRGAPMQTYRLLQFFNHDEIRLMLGGLQSHCSRAILRQAFEMVYCDSDDLEVDSEFLRNIQSIVAEIIRSIDGEH